MLWSLGVIKMPQKQLRKFRVFIANVSLLTVKSETGFQSFILAMHHREMNPGQDAHQDALRELGE